MTDVVEVYQSPDGWRWRKRAGNGEIIAEGEAYTRRGDAVHGANRANPGAIVTVSETPTPDDDQPEQEPTCSPQS